MKATREEEDGNMIKMWAYGRTSVQEKQTEIFADMGRLNMRVRGRGETEEGKRALYSFSVRPKRSCYRAGQYFSVSFHMCYSFHYIRGYKL